MNTDKILLIMCMLWGLSLKINSAKNKKTSVFTVLAFCLILIVEIAEMALLIMIFRMLRGY